MAGKPSKWLPLFEEFVGDLRINSKESVSPDGNGVPLVLWESQHRFLREVAAGLDQGVKTFYTLKSRQLGITTVSLAIDIFWVAMHPGLTMAIVTENDNNREKNRAVLKQYINSFPEGYFGEDFYITKDNRQMMQFSNGSRFDFKVAGTKNKGTSWGEGEGYAAAHLTECASYGSEDGLKSFEEAFAQNNPSSLFIYESPLALDTPIPTPAGWTTMGDVQAGDMVFDEQGKPVQVAGTSEVFTGRKCYRVEFDNGDSIVADADHKWRVCYRRYKYDYGARGPWLTRDATTTELDPARHIIHISEPLDLPDIELPIEPYLLGAWLGDGDTAGGRLTASEEDVGEMQSLIAARGWTIGATTRCKDRAPSFGVNGLRTMLIACGLRGRKHIPPVYFRASERQRRELLAGLMDTDGNVHRENYACCYASTDEALIDDVGHLLSTLGIKYVKAINRPAGDVRLFPQGHYSVCKQSFRLLFSEFPERRLFNLTRKRDIQETPRTKCWRKTKRVRIVAVTEVPSVPVKCIGVDSPSHLFLAGRTMIPTHNTAKGFNLWRDKWMEGLADPLTKRSFFIGWWASGINRIQRSDPRFPIYGTEKPDREEAEKIALVKADYGWTIEPEQLAWYRWRETTDTGGDMLLQNQPWTAQESFVVSGQSFFQTRQLAKDMRAIQEAGEELGWQGYVYEFGNSFFDMQCVWCDPDAEDALDIEDIELRVWEAPVAKGVYVIGCDPAYGRNDHKDRICISVWRCYADKLIQVAEYATYEVETRFAGWVLAHLAGAYVDCIVNLEIYGGGSLIMLEWDHIRQLIDNDMARDKPRNPEWEDALSQARWYLYHRPDSMGAGYCYNFNTTGATKGPLMNGIRGSYVTQELVVRSIPMLREMAMVIQDGSSIGAPDSRDPNSKDDRVFAAAFAHRAWVNWRRPEMMAQNLTYQVVTDDETGVTSRASRTIQGMITRFWANAQALSEEEEEKPSWRVDRGLM